MKCTKEYRLGYTEKAKKIVDGLTLEEKVSLMSGIMSLEQMIKDMKEPGTPLQLHTLSCRRH